MSAGLALALAPEATLLSAPEPATDWRASLRFGYLVLFLSVGLCGGWAALAHIDSAVVLKGSFSAESYRKTVQHLEGGIVSEILVRDGDRVEEGQTLIRLDTTRFEASATAASLALANALATEARLVAQRDMVDYVVMPEEVGSLVGPGGDRGEIDDNNREFEIRRLVLASSLELLESQVAQARNDVEQAGLDTETAQHQLDSVTKELGQVKPLFSKGLVAMSRVTALERQKTQFESAVSKARSEAAKGQNKISELRLRMEAMRRDYRQEASAGLVELAREITRLRQERQVALDMLGRSAIRSPATGTVQGLRVVTAGGVVRSGEPLLDVVPDTDRFVVKGRIPPTDVDRLKKGMAADVNLGALMKYRRETVRGTLSYVSPDAVPDTNASLPPSFAVEVAVERDAVPEDIRDRLQAGMEAAVIIPTEGRTVLQYLLAPVLENVEESLRER